MHIFLLFFIFVVHATLWTTSPQPLATPQQPFTFHVNNIISPTNTNATSINTPAQKETVLTALDCHSIHEFMERMSLLPTEEWQKQVATFDVHQQNVYLTHLSTKQLEYDLKRFAASEDPSTRRHGSGQADSAQSAVASGNNDYFYTKLCELQQHHTKLYEEKQEQMRAAQEETETLKQELLLLCTPMAPLVVAHRFFSTLTGKRLFL
jgi:hypothetical protein